MTEEMTEKKVFLTEEEVLFAAVAPPVSVEAFCERSGLSRVTVARWVEEGFMETRLIYGRRYITAVEMMRFNKRLEAGEFAREMPRPPRRGGNMRKGSRI